MSSQQEGPRTRRSLKTLQHTSSDRENLVGRPCKSLKHQLTQDTSIGEITPDVKRKNISSKETQASVENKITVEDLTNPNGASEKYWEILAGKRQVALQDALDENEKLRKIIDDLKEENTMVKQMLDEANSFVEVIKVLM
ncbi:Geminin [Operophtera brumata]|uniref:Geminin n=1 Tax=Operophtera brumata TaxID=104452 RepID=A0A0L7L168_OPEBR|nr:Geminin [Operophtera brumata]